jgi:hypothetical protein
MAQNVAARQAAKQAKRKAVVAAKRKAEFAEHSMMGQIRAGAHLPIQHCLMSDGLFEAGMGMVLLARGSTSAVMQVAVFMVDTFCLGVKDVHWRSADREETESLLDFMTSSDPASPVEPGEARKLLHDVVAWAEGNGFAAHEDYGVVEKLFGNVVVSDTDYRPRFGREGQVLYIPGPSESPSDVRRRIRIIETRFGKDAVRASVGATIEGIQSLLEDVDIDVDIDEVFDRDDEEDGPLLEGEATEVKTGPGDPA